jgi:glycogen debranching enzyme
MALTVLAGSTFCVSDDLGDVVDGAAGLYADDTRHLSRLVLTVDGQRPRLLVSRNLEHFAASVYLFNPSSPALPEHAVLIRRDRLVAAGAMQDRVVITCLAPEPVAFELALELEADFADVITVKEHELAAGAATGLRLLPPPARRRLEAQELVLSDAGGGAVGTRVVLSRPPRSDGERLVWRVELSPGERWELCVDVHDGDGPALSLSEATRHARDSLAAWNASMPRLRASWGPLERAFERSVADLAALRLPGTGGRPGPPAAGAPWFMAVFGRDSLITSLQTLVLGPELALATLERLAELQATEDDPRIDAEPGKIVHEVRHGKAAPVWFPRYYGTLDATPLYLVLLSELWRWTDDAALVSRFREPALAALAWIDRYGDRDGDGFVEYERRTDRGLPNQSWKDSHDSQRFADGRLARTPIAPCEVQGYVYDAKRRLAEVARDAWDDPALADRLEREARELRARFDEAYWVDRRGGYYALALDGDKRRVDSLCSNIGHLLWSGIVPDERVDALTEALLGDGLWSGWGIRTMSTLDAGYDPLGYHVGTVWPHDCSLIAQGLARYGRWEDAFRIARVVLEASSYFDHRLPEAFAGLPREEAPFPIPYPAACSPQAWAAAATVLLLQVVLGLRPDRRTRTLETVAPAGVGSWLGSVRLSGVAAFGRAWDAQLEGGATSVVAA